MDFLNKGIAQVSDLFRSMTPGARITAGLLLTVVVVSVAYLFNRQTASADVYLLGEQGNFTAGEMSSMQGAFGKANLSGYVVEGNRIRIPRGQQSAYLGALADAGALPANFGDYLTAATKSNVFKSRQQQEDELKVAKQMELALIIRSMQGIESAAVHYDSQRKSGWKTGERTITASVSVKPRGNLPLDEDKVPMIRNLVAGALVGLSPDQVTVTDLNGRTYGPSAGMGGDASQDPYLSRMKKYKSEYESMLYNILSYVPGIVVTVNVELDKEMSHLEEKLKVDPKTVPVRINEQSTTVNSQSGGPGGRPGLQAQQRANSPASVAGAASANKSEEERSQSETQNAISHDKTITNFAPLTPKIVKFSIGVPSSYYEQIWRERNPAPVGQTPKTPDKAALDQIELTETANIRKAAEALLPNLDATKSSVPLVTVTTFAHLPSAPITGPSMAEQAVTWLSGSWSTLGMLGLALFSLMMLRATVRALPAVPAPTPAEQAAAASLAADSAEGTEKSEGGAGGDGGDKPKSRFKRRIGSGPSLRDELTELVREDPDVAANILRSWIGNAS